MEQEYATYQSSVTDKTVYHLALGRGIDFNLVHAYRLFDFSTFLLFDFSTFQLFDFCFLGRKVENFLTSVRSKTSTFRLFEVNFFARKVEVSVPNFYFSSSS